MAGSILIRDDHLPPAERFERWRETLGQLRMAPVEIHADHRADFRFELRWRDLGPVRLEACRRDLADPALASRPVAAIAARWGFTSPAQFSHAFKAAHGMPPGEYRRRAAGIVDGS